MEPFLEQPVCPTKVICLSFFVQLLLVVIHMLPTNGIYSFYA